jgi:hypothetical protein
MNGGRLQQQRSEGKKCYQSQRLYFIVWVVKKERKLINIAVTIVLQKPYKTLEANIRTKGTPHFNNIRLINFCIDIFEGLMSIF